jgi:hypothetical protein
MATREEFDECFATLGALSDQAAALKKRIEAGENSDELRRESQATIGAFNQRVKDLRTLCFELPREQWDRLISVDRKQHPDRLHKLLDWLDLPRPESPDGDVE